MDLRELRYFAAVVEERNLSRAARRCFISQPSISTAIASLESELGATLFIRHAKGVSPTEAADRLYPIARRMLDQAEAAVRLFRAPAERRPLTLGLLRSLDIRRTAALLEPLAREPDVQLRLVGADEPCDARVVSSAMVAPGEDFVVLWQERYVVALPPQHPLALADRLRAADLADMPLVDRCHCEHHELFARAGKRLETAAIAHSEEWALALVALGLGMAIIPEGVAGERHDVAVREVVDVDVSRQIGLAFGASGPPSAAVQALIERVSAARPKRRRAAPARRS